MIMEILHICMQRGCRLWTIKDRYRLGDDIEAKVLAFAFGLSAEIERQLISQRTREALARRKAEGKHIGRPARPLSTKNLSLYKHRDAIAHMRKKGKSMYAIANAFHVSINTVKRYLDRVEANYGTISYTDK